MASVRQPSTTVSPQNARASRGYPSGRKEQSFCLPRFAGKQYSATWECLNTTRWRRTTPGLVAVRNETTRETEKNAKEKSKAADLHALVEEDGVDALAVLVDEVVELGLELVGVDLAGLREGGDGHRKGEDEAEGADGYA